MATSVATPLERHLGQIADVTEMTSSSSVGSTRITLQFGLDRDINGAARDVQAAINAARADLPTSLRSNPDLSQGQPRRCADHDPGAHLEHPDRRPDLRRGVTDPGAEALAGGRHRPGRSSAAARCRRCASSSTRARSSNTGSGSRTCARRSPRRTPTARRASIDEASAALPDLRQRPGDQGRPIPLARGRLSQRRPGAARRRGRGRRFGREPAQRAGSPTASRRSSSSSIAQPGANIIDTVDRVKALLPQLQASIPTDIDITVAMDRSTTIRHVAQATSSAR